RSCSTSARPSASSLPPRRSSRASRAFLRRPRARSTRSFTKLAAPDGHSFESLAQAIRETGRHADTSRAAMEGRTLTSIAPQQRVPSGLGTRLRQLRVAAGLTQADLAGERFSKEYVSQIERGKTRPTPQTLAWIAERLGVDTSYLETGQTWDEYAEVEAAVVRAEAAVEGQRYDKALEALEDVTHSPEARELEFRALLAESWARMSHGQLRPALDLLGRARELSEDV